MNGFIIINYETGMQIYHKQYVPGFGFRNESGEDSPGGEY
jgi:hypothetical protein